MEWSTTPRSGFRGSSGRRESRRARGSRASGILRISRSTLMISCRAIAGFAFVLIAGAGCGTSANARAGAGKAVPLSAAQLAYIVVEPPSPYTHVPDSEKDTGLMEVGNPKAGTIG